MNLFDLALTRTQARSPRLEWVSLRLFINPNVELIQKSVYSAFDVIRDLGGAACMTLLVSSLLTHLFTYNQLQNVMVAELYRKPDIFWNPKQEINGSKILSPDD